VFVEYRHSEMFRDEHFSGAENVMWDCDVLWIALRAPSCRRCADSPGVYTSKRLLMIARTG